jgi:hypothetical protein
MRLGLGLHAYSPFQVLNSMFHTHKHGFRTFSQHWRENVLIGGTDTQRVNRLQPSRNGQDSCVYWSFVWYQQ